MSASNEDKALGDVIAQLNETNPFMDDKGGYSSSDSDSGHDVKTKARFGAADDYTDSESDGDDDGDMFSAAQALEQLVLAEQDVAAAAKNDEQVALQDGADAKAAAALDTLASTREDDEARMRRYNELRRERDRAMQARGELMSSSFRARASAALSQILPEADTFDDYLDEITSSSFHPRGRHASRNLARSARGTSSRARSYARASSQNQPQQDLQGQQLAALGTMVYQRQAQFRELTGRKDWQLDVPRWTPAREVDTMSESDTEESEEDKAREDAALNRLEQALGL